MLDFISIPLTCTVVFAAIYGVFELFVRRKERLAIIEKLSDRIDSKAIEGKIRFPGFINNLSFSALKAGALLTGVGLGLLVGFIINLILLQNIAVINEHWFRHDMIAVAYGASVLFFGGIGLIIAFVIELKLSKKQP